MIVESIFMICSFKTAKFNVRQYYGLTFHVQYTRSSDVDGPQQEHNLCLSKNMLQLTLVATTLLFYTLQRLVKMLLWLFILLPINDSKAAAVKYGKLHERHNVPISCVQLVSADFAI